MNKRDCGTFSDEDLEFISSLCASLAVSVSNCKRRDVDRAHLEQSHAELDALRKDLTNACEQSASAKSILERSMVLARTVAALSCTKDTAQLFADTIMHAREISGAERGTLFIADNDAKELYSRVAEGYTGEAGHEIRLPMNDGSLVGHCALMGELLNIDDAYQDPRFNPEVDRRTGFKTSSVLCLPAKDNQVGSWACCSLLTSAGALNRSRAMTRRAWSRL